MIEPRAISWFASPGVSNLDRRVRNVPDTGIMRSNNENPPSHRDKIRNRLLCKQYGVFRSGHGLGFRVPNAGAARAPVLQWSCAACEPVGKRTMQITVAGKQVDLSDALRTRVSTQMDTIAGKYFDHALEAHVTFSRARSFFTCDINLHAGRGLQLRGEGEAAEAQHSVRRRSGAYRQAPAPLPTPGQRPPPRHGQP